ncbi:MAG: T9SS type A sorting domain-containing protein [Bacteroidota bacterium]
MLALGLSSFASFAQTLQTDQFTALTPGDISTTITGTPAGQDSWFTFASNGTAPTTTTNSATTNFQATVTGNPAAGLVITGPNGDKGSRYMWKDGLPTAWAARTVGNDIIELEVDINTGLASTSRNTFGVYIFDAAGTKVLAGFTVRAATKEIFLVAYSTPGANPVGNYTYSLAAAPGIQLPEDAWSRIGLSYNVVTGEVLLKGPGIDPLGVVVDGSAPGTGPAEVDIISFSGHVAATPNTSSASMTFDNLVVRASATDTLLGNDSFVSGDTTSIKMYPNPATDVLNIQSATEVLTKVSITDLNGRVVKEATNNLSQISLGNLAKGIYLVTIESATAKKVEKLIVE